MTNALTTPADPAAALAAITAAYEALGMQRAADMGEYGRAKVTPAGIEIDDELFIGNPNTGEPAIYARILAAPREHQGVWLTPDDATRLGRPTAADSFCKSYYDRDDQAGKISQDGTSCETCPIKPYIKRSDSPLENFKKCSWRGDLELHRLIRENDTWIQADDRILTLSLSTTAMIQYKGTSKDKKAGIIDGLDNFLFQLGIFAIQAFPDLEPQRAVNHAALALQTGAIIAGIGVRTAKSADGSRNFPLPVISPIDIAPPESQPETIAATVTADSTPPTTNVTPASDFDDLPF